jgi:hypothetical protein
MAVTGISIGVPIGVGSGFRSDFALEGASSSQVVKTIAAAKTAMTVLITFIVLLGIPIG